MNWPTSRLPWGVSPLACALGDGQGVYAVPAATGAAVRTTGGVARVCGAGGASGGGAGQASCKRGERRFVKADQFGGTSFMNFPRPLRVRQQGATHADQIEVTPAETPQEFIQGIWG